MDPITNEILKIGISETAKLIFKSLLSRNWIEEYKSGRNIVEQLNSLDVHGSYVVKHVSRVLKMRTIHSSENDVTLNDIYHPLSIYNGKDELKVGNKFVLSDNCITNIIGFAGQGKSTILRKMLLESIKNGNKIPFFLELRKVEKSGIESAVLILLNELGVDAKQDNLSSLLKSDSVVLLLDGFDEVSSDMREKVLDEILSLNRNYNLQIICTTRGGTEICSEPGVINYRVNKIKKSDIVSILRKLSQSQEVEQDTLSQIFEMLRGNTSLVETMNSPLLVTLFYICYPHLDSIPNSAIEFYSKLFTTLYFRHDKIKNFKRERKSNIMPSEAFEAFCAFCFKSLYDNKQDFTHQSILDYTKQSLNLCGVEGCQPENMAYDFIDITCLIQRDGYDRYVFLHKSIQEYHAAEYVKLLSLDKKKHFMSAILQSIRFESKMSATARYLYEIDRENTFNLICAPLCEEFKLDEYADNEESMIESIYELITNDVEFCLSERPEKGGGQTEGNIIEGIDVFGEYISSVGPFLDLMKPISIFTRYYNGDMVSPYNNAMVNEVINSRYTNLIFSADCNIYERNKDEGNAANIESEPYYVIAAELINKLGRKKKIKNKIKEITDNIYKDAFLDNKTLIGRKDDALKQMLGF